LVEIPCWLLHYGGDPLTVARKIAAHFEEILLDQSNRNGEGKSGTMTRI
jgi:hypothetical protein